MNTQEMQIIRSLYNCLSDNGRKIVYSDEDGHEEEIFSLSDLIENIQYTDMEVLQVLDSTNDYIGSVYLIWGNSPYECISDYSVRLHSIIKPVIAIAKVMEAA